MKRLSRGVYRLSSGRQVEAYDDHFSLNVKSLEAMEGFDGYLHCWPNPDVEREGWTSEERRELAEFMIEKWRAFADATGPVDG